MILYNKIAKEYVIALHNACKNDDALFNSAKKDLSAIDSFVNSEDLNHEDALFKAMDDKSLHAIVNDMSSTLKLSKDITLFLRVLIENAHFHILKDVLIYWAKYTVIKAKSVSVEVISAIDLDSSMMSAVKSAIEGIFKKPAEITVTIDRNIIGGLIVKADYKVIDLSILGKINKINNLERGL